MIGAMRKNRKILSIVLWIVIVAFVSTIFVVWGVGSNENTTTYAAKVGDETITFDEYRTAYEQKLNAVRQIFGADFAGLQNDSAEFSRLVLNDIINSKLILKEADRLKIPATDFEMIETIRSIPSFQKDGAFDPDTYVDVLRANRQTPAFFEQSLRDSIKIDKFQQMVKNAQYAVSDSAAENEYKFRNLKATAEYFSVPVDYNANSNVSADNLSAFYEKTKEIYRIPTKIKMKYLVFDKNKFADNVTVSEAEVENFYNGNLAAYTVPETIDIRNIGVTAKNPKDEKELAAAKIKIEAALAGLKSGAKFTDMVEKYSDEPLKIHGGLINNVSRSQMQGELAEAIFTLKQGEFSEIIKTENGYLIILIEKKNLAKVSTLQEVKKEINEKIKKDKLAGDFRKYVYDLYRDVLNAGNITAYLHNKPDSTLKVMETKTITENDKILPVLDNVPDMKKKMFGLNKTEMSQVVSDGDNSYFFEIFEKEDSFIPLLDVVMNQVTAAYKKETAIQDTLKNVSESITKDGFEKTAKQFNAKIETTAPFLRSEGGIEFAGVEELITSIFKSKPGDTVNKAYLIGNDVYGIKVKSITPPSMDKFSEEKEAITSYIRSVKEEEAIASYLDFLKTKTKVAISPEFVQNIVDTKKEVVK